MCTIGTLRIACCWRRVVRVIVMSLGPGRVRKGVAVSSTQLGDTMRGRGRSLVFMTSSSAGCAGRRAIGLCGRGLQSQ